MKSSEKHFIAGPAGQLEAYLDLPTGEASANEVAVVCHPHSLYGGSMRNKVVHILADSFTGMGLPTVRFNFRGVGKSEGMFDQGQGEQADLKAVVDWLRQRYPGASLWLAGFSFGAFVAYQAHRDVAAARLLLIAPPVRMFEFEHPEPVTVPWMVVQGSEDEIVPFETVESWVAVQPGPPTFHLMQGASHFFHGRLNDLKAILQQAWGQDIS